MLEQVQSVHFHHKKQRAFSIVLPFFQFLLPCLVKILAKSFGKDLLIKIFPCIYQLNIEFSFEIANNKLSFYKNDFVNWHKQGDRTISCHRKYSRRYCLGRFM